MGRLGVQTHQTYLSNPKPSQADCRGNIFSLDCDIHEPVELLPSLCFQALHQAWAGSREEQQNRVDIWKPDII